MQLFFSNWHFLYYYFRFPKNKTGTDSFMSILEVGFKTEIIHGVVKTNCRRRTTAIDGNLHREKNIGQRVKNKSKSLGND